MSKNLGWQEFFVKDLIEAGHAETKTGPFGTQLKASSYVDSGTPVINVRNIGFGNVRPEKLEFIGPATVERLSTHLLLEDDIVFGRKGAVERHAFIRPEQRHWFQGSDCLRLRFKANNLVLPRFVSYFLLTEEHKSWMMNQCSHGATMASLNQDIISRIPLRLPSLPTQRKIASILSAYDDLIENNTRRIAILEEMAQAIYREWFVNFRFPGHENVKLLESPLGQIPEGWEVGKLEDILVLQRGFDLPIKNRIAGDVPIYASTGVTGFHNKVKVRGPGVLTGRSGSLGTVTYIHEDFWPLNTTLWIKEFKWGTPIFAFFVLSSIDFETFNSGAAVPSLNRNNVHGLPMVLPQSDVITAFDEIAGDIFDEAKLLRRKSEILRTTRDLLLPKLISGQLDVEALDIDVGEPPEELEEAAA